MKKRNGFTLVELLAVIVLLSLIMAIAVPSALKMSSRVKEKSYETKIELIEKAASNYGMSNLGLLKMGIRPNDITGATTSANAHRFACFMTFDGKDKLTQVNYTDKGTGDSATKNDNEYWCFRVKVSELVASNDLDWDNKNNCKDKCTADNKVYYDNTVINPKTNYIINECYVYVYHKYNRVYTAYDKKTCDMANATPTTANGGHEYKPL